MNQDTFTQLLSDEQFPAPVLVSRPAHGFIDAHQHAFEAKALIVQGELALNVDGVATLYRVGDVFHLPANQVHTETYGAEGVEYLVGRK